MQLEQKFIQALHALRHHRLHAPQKPIHEVYQSSTINALLEGVYDGDMTYGQLRRHGDFGIGTFNALDGEMIGFDGRFWQITGDGRAHPVPDEYQTPFATVLFFNPRIQQTLDGPLDYAGLCALLDSELASANLFYAIRLMVDSAMYAPAACPGNRNRIHHLPPSRKTSRASICMRYPERWRGSGSRRSRRA